MPKNQAGKEEVDARSVYVGNISDKNLYDSLFSEPPHISNWFSSYVYESPMLDTSDCFEMSDPRESECIKEIEIKLLSDGLELVDEPPQSQADLSEFPDVVDVVEDSEIDEADKANNCRSSIFRKFKRKENIAANKISIQSHTASTTDETELASLKNRVNYLEDEVRKLHDLINRLISSNGIYSL